jgi:hypothetical protein
VGKFPICIFDVSQGALIGLIEGLRKFIQSMLDACGKAAPKVEDLTINPSEHPVGLFYEHINDPFLVGRCPSSHIRICVYDRPDIVFDILAFVRFRRVRKWSGKSRVQGRP